MHQGEPFALAYAPKWTNLPLFLILHAFWLDYYNQKETVCSCVLNWGIYMPDGTLFLTTEMPQFVSMSFPFRLELMSSDQRWISRDPLISHHNNVNGLPSTYHGQNPTRMLRRVWLSCVQASVPTLVTGPVGLNYGSFTVIHYLAFVKLRLYVLENAIK
jgi:hypothetical protein